MAGVPSIMQAMLDEVAPKLKTGIRMLSETVRADAREGDIGTQLGEIAKANPDVAIGSYPFFDPQHGPNTNVVLRARDPQKLATAKRAVEDMLARVRGARRSSDGMIARRRSGERSAMRQQSRRLIAAAARRRRRLVALSLRGAWPAATPVARRSLRAHAAMPRRRQPRLSGRARAYFKPSSPQRADLVEPDSKARLVELSGLVLTRACRPVARALVDLWHADERGDYDNRGFRYRGHLFTDAEGRYRFRTILPALYPGRTRHYHVKVQAPERPVSDHAALFSRRGGQPPRWPVPPRAGDAHGRSGRGLVRAVRFRARHALSKFARSSWSARAGERVQRRGMGMAGWRMRAASIGRRSPDLVALIRPAKLMQTVDRAWRTVRRSRIA